MVSTSYNLAPAQLAAQQQNQIAGTSNSHSYAAMRMSQQAFSNPGTGLQSYASGTLGNSSFNNTGGMVRNQQNNTAGKQFDSSKSANTINYVNSAYMSQIPSKGGLAKAVGLKQHPQGQNSRQPANVANALGNGNYTDGTVAFLGHQAGAPGRTSSSQGPAVTG